MEERKFKGVLVNTNITKIPRNGMVWSLPRKGERAYLVVDAYDGDEVLCTSAVENIELVIKTKNSIYKMTV